jgi:hypothetical protein
MTFHPGMNPLALWQSVRNQLYQAKSRRVQQKPLVAIYSGVAG